jgi:hypothetical protein
MISQQMIGEYQGRQSIQMNEVENYQGQSLDTSPTLTCHQHRYEDVCCSMTMRPCSQLTDALYRNSTTKLKG